MAAVRTGSQKAIRSHRRSWGKAAGMGIFLMSILGVNGVFANARPHANRTQKTDKSRASFAEQLQKIKETTTSKMDAYTKYLKHRYGAGVSIQNVGKDQSSIDRIGAGTAGTGNVVIAPNILEQMANDPEKAAYYEGKIQHYFNSVPRYQAELSAMGHEIHSSGIVIHPDGTVTHYISGDLKPEVRAKIEARIKAEQEGKKNRREKYQELSQEAAEKRKMEMELAYKEWSAAEAGKVTFMGTPETMNSSIAAYGKNIMEVTGILK